MEEKIYENRQIARVDGNQKLLELQSEVYKAGAFPTKKTDKQTEVPTLINPLDTESKVKLVLCDYSSNQSVSVYFNLNKKCLFELYEMARCRHDFSKEEIRIAGVKKENGLNPVRKLTVNRQSKDQNGNPKTYNFYIKIEEGGGVREKGKNGGFYLKNKTYVKEKEAYINLTQLDVEFLLKEGLNYWNDMESAYRSEIAIEELLSNSLNKLYVANKKAFDKATNESKREIVEAINNLPL